MNLFLVKIHIKLVNLKESNSINNKFNELKWLML